MIIYYKIQFKLFDVRTTKRMDIKRSKKGIKNPYGLPIILRIFSGVKLSGNSIVRLSNSLSNTFLALIFFVILVAAFLSASVLNTNIHY